ncbi:MAG: shikimate kinase, partial [Proteobacteria bacterium]|nr:shikimate kinase [Pseudomonadota bacterium]
SFIDSDREIEQHEKLSINEIFETKGEQYFRDVEAEVISNIINGDQAMVLSLGGGAFTSPKVRQLVKSSAVSIWLDCDIDTIVGRTSVKSRPLLQKGDKKEILTNLMDKRRAYYQQADLKVDTSQVSKLVIDEIISKINNFIKEND